MRETLFFSVPKSPYEKVTMKKIGILRGMAPESTLQFYRQLAMLAQQNLPGRQYPTIIIYSLNMETFRKPLKSKDYPGAISILSHGIGCLSRAGADFAIISSNTPHIFFDELAQKPPIPLLSILHEVAKEAERRGFAGVGLFGTKFTMEGEFFTKEFKEHDISVAVPEYEDRDYIHQKTMGQLADGKIVESTKRKLVEICKKMVRAN